VEALAIGLQSNHPLVVAAKTQPALAIAAVYAIERSSSHCDTAIWRLLMLHRGGGTLSSGQVFIIILGSHYSR